MMLYFSIVQSLTDSSYQLNLISLYNGLTLQIKPFIGRVDAL